MPSGKKNEAPLTLTQLVKFYDEFIEPRLSKIDSIDSKVAQLERTMNERFDDLYKKFEDLRQEYIVANSQMKRLEKSDDVLKQDLLELKSQVAHLQKKIDEFEKHLSV